MVRFLTLSKVIFITHGSLQYRSMSIKALHKLVMEVIYTFASWRVCPSLTNQPVPGEICTAQCMVYTAAMDLQLAIVLQDKFSFGVVCLLDMEQYTIMLCSAGKYKRPRPSYYGVTCTVGICCNFSPMAEWVFNIWSGFANDDVLGLMLKQGDSLVKTAETNFLLKWSSVKCTQNVALGLKIHFVRLKSFENQQSILWDWQVQSQNSGILRFTGCMTSNGNKYSCWWEKVLV